MVNAGANVCVYIVPMKQNLNAIESLIEMVHDIGVRRVRILSLSPTGRAKAQFDHLELSEDDAKVLNNELLKAKRKTK